MSRAPLFVLSLILFVCVCAGVFWAGAALAAEPSSQSAVPASASMKPAATHATRFDELTTTPLDSLPLCLAVNTNREAHYVITFVQAKAVYAMAVRVTAYTGWVYTSTELRVVNAYRAGIINDVEYVRLRDDNTAVREELVAFATRLDNLAVELSYAMSDLFDIDNPPSNEELDPSSVKALRERCVATVPDIGSYVDAFEHLLQTRMLPHLKEVDTTIQAKQK